MCFNILCYDFNYIVKILRKRIFVCKLFYIWYIFCGSFVFFYLGIIIYLNKFDIFYNDYVYYMFYKNVYE